MYRALSIFLTCLLGSVVVTGSLPAHEGHHEASTALVHGLTHADHLGMALLAVAGVVLVYALVRVLRRRPARQRIK